MKKDFLRYGESGMMERMAERAALGEDVEETRTVEFVASDNTRDSHGTVLPVDKWDLDRFNKNGLVTYQHVTWSSDPDMIIGRGEARVVRNKLVVRITFEPAELNPVAEKVFRKVLAGTLRGVSVGFRPTTREIGHWGTGKEARGEERETFYFDGQELMEVSVVALPSNKNSVRRGVGDDLVRCVYDMLGGERSYSEVERMTFGEVMEAARGLGEHVGKKDMTGEMDTGEKRDEDVKDEGDEEWERRMVEVARAKMML